MKDNKSIEQMQEELKALQSKLDFLMTAVDNLPNPIFMKDEDAKFFFFNKAYSDFFKMRRRDYVGKTVLDLDYLSVEDRKKFQNEDLKLIEDAEVLTYKTDFPDENGNARTSFYWSSGFHDKASGKNGLVGEIVDISKEHSLQQSLDKSLAELKLANERLRIMAQTDPGSGLYNRSILWSKGRELIKQTIAADQPVSMIMMDLDYFKTVNDTFGHLKGDEIIESFARIVKSESRKTDLPIRFGGDEFVLVLFNVCREKAVNIAERIKTSCEKNLVLPDGRSVTISAGVIEIDKDVDFESNLTKLDDVLYRAKAEGRDCVISA